MASLINFKSQTNRLVASCVVTLLLLSSGSTATAQTVQLPTFNTFSYSGSVLVPDGGTTSLGSVSRAGTNRTRRPFGHSAGGFRSHAGLSVSAQIIDLDEMDRQIRGVDRSGQKSASSKLQSMSHQEQRIEMGKAIVRYARHLYREDQQSKSFDQYVRAVKVLDGRLQRLAAAEFRRVFGTAANQALAPLQL